MMSAQKPLILFICVGVLAASLQAAPPSASRQASPTFIDVALSPAGGVSGCFIDSCGQGIHGASATLFHGENVVETTLTQPDGTYHFPQAQAGVYRVNLDGQWQMIRVWEPTLQPPAARASLTVVRQELVVRGERLSESLAGQIGLGIFVAGGIAGGFAIAESRDSRQEVTNLPRQRKLSSP